MYVRNRSESGHDETSDQGNGSTETGSTRDRDGSRGRLAVDRGLASGLGGNNGNVGLGRVSVNGRVGSSAVVVGRRSLVSRRRDGVVSLDNGDEGGRRTANGGGVARDSDGLVDSNDGGVRNGVSLLGGLGSLSGELVVVLLLGLGGLLLSLGRLLLATLDLEGERVLENLGVALELEDETVDVVGADGRVDLPGVGSSVVVNTGSNGLDGDLGVLGSTTDQRDGDLLAGVLGLGLPGDLEGLTGLDLLPVAGGEDGVEVSDLGKSLGGESHEGSGGDGELHLEGWI
ncbi:hypothetical protein HG531_002407 [Fusarium graminearum]|nr:hypothetical protein HG531_002407 [Fusarium graminearum]